VTELGRDVEATLARLTEAMAEARDDWWLIGSAAVALHGADPGRIADLDVLLSEADARRILPVLGLPAEEGRPDDRFASQVFASWHGAPLVAEFMAGLSQWIDGEWQPVMPRSRVEVAGEGWRVFVPDRSELAAILRSFGRPKDLRRLAALEALSRARP
jgi:hypothetical protein